MTEVIMPKMGDGMEEGTLIAWLKKEGEAVKSGEVIGTIQTDKATLELEAPGNGTLGGFKIVAGDTVPVGTPIAAIMKDGEKLPSNWASQVGTPQSTVKPTEAVANVAPPVTAPSSTDGRSKASPLARRIASDAGLDIATVAGSGPGGRVVERDVHEAIARVSVAAPLPSAAASPRADDTKVALNPLRKITAQRTQESKQQVPHFYVTLDCDVERLVELRVMFKQGGEAPSINDFVMLACAKALREMPEVNASFGGDHVLQHGAVNLGMAVAVDQGLLVAVLRNADTLTVRQISSLARALADKAHAGKLLPDEMTGSTFSVSNMGMLNVDAFVAIINTPNAGILAASTASKRAVVAEDGAIVARTVMSMTGSFDHRVVDGATGARFMNLVRGYLEAPARLVS